VSLDDEGLDPADADGERVRGDRAALRARIMMAALDPARLQTCPEVEALAARVAAAWSPSGLDRVGPDSDAGDGPAVPDRCGQAMARGPVGPGRGGGPDRAVPIEM
jgi:hypothetical protein